MTINALANGNKVEMLKVPVVTACFHPFRFVQRTEADTWTVTVPELNSRTYDYVKLHRNSANLDVGIAPFSMGVCFDGTFFLPSTEEFQDPTIALSQFNSTLAEMFLGGIFCEAVAPDDLGHGTICRDGYVRILNGATGSAGALHMAARTKHISNLDVIKLLKPKMISVKEIQAALTRGRKLVKALGDVPREQIIYATTFYSRKQWTESLIHVWTVTERIVEIAWQRHVIGVDSTSNKSRRDFLNDFRTWTASAKLELLYQKGLVPFEAHEILNQARKARNDFAHLGKVPSPESATTAMKACFNLASLCASDFKDKKLFDHALSLILPTMEIGGNRTARPAVKPEYWIDLPPIPGDSNWGNRDYEQFPDIRLKPLKHLKEHAKQLEAEGKLLPSKKLQVKKA